MENIFIYGSYNNRLETFLVHNTRQAYRILNHFPATSCKVLEQLPNENWKDFIHRATRLTTDKIHIDTIQHFLDLREFCTSEENFEGEFHLQAIPNPEGKFQFPYLDITGNILYESVNLIRLKHITFPNVEITTPFEIDDLNRIIGQWVKRVDNTGFTYWECVNARVDSSRKTLNNISETK